LPALPPAAAAVAGRCPVCDGPLAPRLTSWLLRCPRCGLWRSLLGTAGGELRENAALDEERRVAGLAELRQANYAHTLATLSNLVPLGGKRLLDVGCAYGWFLEAAAAAGMAGTGVEPDPAIAEQARQRGLSVLTGYFPTALESGAAAGEGFDVIAFNDVLEHLGDVRAAAAACHRLLRPGGLVVVSAPDSGGVLFRLAIGLARLGRRGLLERLWQRGYPSPHLSYFNSRNLTLLWRREGFQRCAGRQLRSLRLRGMWPRLHMDRKPSLGSALAYLGLVGAYPWLAGCCPSDQRLSVFSKRD
jgi:SAM-dependent methyltransferase